MCILLWWSIGCPAPFVSRKSRKLTVARKTILPAEFSSTEVQFLLILKVEV